MVNNDLNVCLVWSGLRLRLRLRLRQVGCESSVAVWGGGSSIGRSNEIQGVLSGLVWSGGVAAPVSAGLVWSGGVGIPVRHNPGAA